MFRKTPHTASATPNELARMLADTLERLVAHLLPYARRAGPRYVVGSLAGEAGQSLQIDGRGPKQGHWRDYATGEYGDPLDLIAGVRCGGNLGGAIRWARDWLQLDESEYHFQPAPRPAPPAATPKQTHETLSPWGRSLWASCQSITPGDPAGRYLTGRCCCLPHPDGDLGWHPSLPHPSGHVGPALVALVTHVQDADRWMTLHRTWIAADGSGRKAFDHLPKADRPPARLLLAGHRKAGGVIRLWPDAEVTLGLGIAEGTETGLSLAHVFRPVWAAIDAGNLAAMPYLHGVESLTVGVDHDPAGLHAFERIKATWLAGAKARGVHGEVWKIINPRIGGDINDLVRHRDAA